MSLPSSERSLDVQREEYRRNRFLAMPLAGTLAWIAVAVAGWLLSPRQAMLALYIATGCIFYLGLLLAKLTGEDLLGRKGPKNAFDALFMHGLVQAVLVYAIAIPFAIVEPRAAPMGVGILAGLMWLPHGWIIRHWIGAFHAISRSVLLVAGWFLFPNHQYIVVPVIIVAIYAITIYVTEARWRRIKGDAAGADHALSAKH